MWTVWGTRKNCFLGDVPKRVFGHVPGYPPGSLFASRAELFEAGVHRHRQAGIAGSQSEGAESVVLSGGYEDDRDFGDELIYTGFGGRDQRTGRQVSDQPFTLWNRALAYSQQNGLPVRVIRGATHNSRYSPPAGYSYDGLYAVEDHWRERGESGFWIWRFRLVRIPDRVVPGQTIAEAPSTYHAARRRHTTVARVVRDTAQSRRIKDLHSHKCQVCGVRLEGSAGPYAEAAHIRPLGTPHDGPDTPDNILCLCPNHHALFDYGGFTINADLSLAGEEGTLTTHPQHRLNKEYLRYRREHYGEAP